MKKIIFPVLGLFLLMVISCQKDPAEPKGLKAKDRILGKWLMERTTNDYYHPISVLEDHEEYIGTAEDSIIFKNNGMLYAYSPGNGEEEIEYYMNNDSTITIDGDEVFKIRKLTATELYLYAEETDLVRDEKEIIKGFFHR